MAVDPTFGVNDYNKPKTLTETETLVSNILMILFGEPGFYPSLPNLGMNIKQYLYLFEDDVDVSAIKSKLVTQCKDFSSSIDSSEFDVVKTTYENHTMLLFLLPVITDSKIKSVTLGITTNDSGDIVFNFVENKYQII